MSEATLTAYRPAAAAWSRVAFKRQDAWNVGMIFFACCLAHVAPSATLLGAYAILGPAHYLTEISWLQDRKFFVGNGKLAAIPLVLLAIVFSVAGATPIGCAALAAALTLSVVASVRSLDGRALAGSGVAGLLVYILDQVWGEGVVVAALLIPTIVHVAAFTFAFIVRGAMRQCSVAGWLPAGAMIVGFGSFLLLPSASIIDPSPPRLVHDTFGAAAEALSIFGWHPSLAGVLGLLGFSYLYHYLNWFSKTASVGWHRTSRRRLTALVGAWIVVSAAYLVNFRLGFLLSLPLSVAHVFLEFPLNAVTLRAIAGKARPT